MKWLGHRDLCPIQWGEECDCVDPQEAEDATQADQSEAPKIPHRQAPCIYPSRSNGDGRGCEMSDCPRHGHGDDW